MWQSGLELSPSYEDDDTIRKHVAQMKSELKHRTPNLSIIKDKLARTQHYRQQYCHSHTTADVLAEFPALCIFAFVSCSTVIVMLLPLRFWDIFEFLTNSAKQYCNFSCDRTA